MRLQVASFGISCIFTARKRSLGQGNMFTGVCLSTGRVPAPGGGACCRGVWSWGGCLLREGACLGGSGHGGVPAPGGCLLWEGGLVETPPDDYCCGRYASFWNAFLLTLISQIVHRYFQHWTNLTNSRSLQNEKKLACPLFRLLYVCRFSPDTSGLTIWPFIAGRDKIV